MKKLRFVFLFGALVVLLFAVVSAYGGQEKVDVCHITGTYDFGSGDVPIGHVINIADPAYDSHIAHGDPEVWNIVTLDDGSEVCSSVFKYVFTTNDTYQGNLGGLAGADAICQAAAEDGGLPGTYKAWLSTDVKSAADRLTHSDVP